MGFYIYISLFLISYIIGCFFFLKEVVPSIISNIKCKKVTGCLKEDCRLRPYCKHTAYTEEEKRKIYEKIESL